MTKKAFFIAITILGIVLNGCSKGDAPVPVVPRTAKLSIFIPESFSKSEGNSFIAKIQGSKEDGEAIDWKVNSRQISGKEIRVDTADFTEDGTIVIESLDSLTSVYFDILSSKKGKLPYTVSWKLEANGEIKDEGNHTVTDGEDLVYSQSVRF